MRIAGDVSGHSSTFPFNNCVEEIENIACSFHLADHEYIAALGLLYHHHEGVPRILCLFRLFMNTIDVGYAFHVHTYAHSAFVHVHPLHCTHKEVTRTVTYPVHPALVLSVPRMSETHSTHPRSE